jgi:hypothetical protein
MLCWFTNHSLDYGIPEFTPYIFIPFLSFLAIAHSYSGNGTLNSCRRTILFLLCSAQYSLELDSGLCGQPEI